MDLVLEDIEDQKLEAAADPAGSQAGGEPEAVVDPAGSQAGGEPGAPAAPPAQGPPRAQGRYLQLLQKDSLERVLSLICDVLEGAPGALRAAPRAAATAAPGEPPPEHPEPAGGTGEPGAALSPSPGCSLLSRSECSELLLAASPCCTAEGTGVGQQDRAADAATEQSQAPAEEPAEEPAEAAGEPRDAWRGKGDPQPGAAQHQPPLWPEPLDAGALQKLQEEVLRQPLFSRARKLFDSWLRSDDSAQVPAPVPEDMLNELVVAALHKASRTPPPPRAPSTPEHPRPAPPDLPPSFLQRVIQKLGLKMPGRREAQKP
ncbi:large proline-rich protein BAG6-like [Dromaius novaehollandiae]|uniref:large proline-rich protein BAG6-like n=1 Tax=Dromaius novaehollandiae TaxID=8790 RepID=UPI00311EB334